MLTRKGVFPYSYMDSFTRFEETSLPPRDAFYNNLKQSHISDEDYDFAQDLWRTFKLKNLGDLHDLYMETDVFLLCDVFETFRDCSLENYGLDPAHFTTAPGLSWAACLKYTKVKLEIPTDADMHLFFDKGLTGGISMVANHYAKANNPQVEGYNPKLPQSYIAFYDCNNQYGMAMCDFLPTHGFKWIHPSETTSPEYWREFILNQKDEQDDFFLDLYPFIVPT